MQGVCTALNGGAFSAVWDSLPLKPRTKVLWVSVRAGYNIFVGPGPKCNHFMLTVNVINVCCNDPGCCYTLPLGLCVTAAVLCEHTNRCS